MRKKRVTEKMAKAILEVKMLEKENKFDYLCQYTIYLLWCIKTIFTIWCYKKVRHVYMIEFRKYK